MKKRTITAIIMLLILTPLFIIPKMFIGMQIIIGILSLIALYELLSNSNLELNIQTKIIVYSLSVITYTSLIWYKGDLNTTNFFNLINYKSFLILILSTFILFIITIFNDKFNIKDVGNILSYILYTTFGLGSIVIIRITGIEFIVLLFLTTMLTDIFAYTFGVKFGKNKLAPNISPNKSWEGSIFGTITTTIIVGTLLTLYGYIFKGNIFNPNNIKTILDGISSMNSLNLFGKALIIYLLVFILSILGQLGDLFASKIKREFNIKDFGYIFPGHGGVLDRFDSAMFVSMALTLILAFLIII